MRCDQLYLFRHVADGTIMIDNSYIGVTSRRIDGHVDVGRDTVISLD